MNDHQPKNLPVILVVDDEAHIVRVVAFKLRAAGFEVLEAGNGEEALDRVAERTVDLVLTDRQMPLLDGLGLARRLAEEAKTASIPVVMLTARGFRLTPEELAEAGVCEMIDKPFSPRVLVERIRAILNRDEQRSEAA